MAYLPSDYETVYFGLVTIGDSTDKRRCGFRPSRSQEDVHNAITAPTYIGKDADTFLDHVRISKATKFLAHPAVTPRLYDIEFGPCDLSILHFPRFDLDDQISRQKQNKINMRNYSTKVELPDIPANPQFNQLVESLGVLLSYAREFFNTTTQALVVSAKEFGERLEDFAPWTSQETKILAYWFSNVFAAYRLAVYQDQIPAQQSNLASTCTILNCPDYCLKLLVSGNVYRQIP
ncbi:LOW QUALITY PROTEIN: hypothetical protein PHMEG_0009923 [Phytophthora megakarya]|uniref:Uncharacterized protein n=1 Tax=Phytophthora megakarya TaxID=4795 RepID=A0A225WFK1_9STRA|nr:LOW QUALITY PROTEIN: hypothetical protein PHMEG_0009923 [Phytophthora megakarya]